MWSCGRRPGEEEAARQGGGGLLGRARASTQLLPLARGRRQGGSGDGLGRAAGPGGLPGERQVVLLSLSISVFIYLFCSVLF